MLAYGGNGPVFAAIQAEELGIDRVFVPRASPTFSALGTLVADPTIDEERSIIAQIEDLPLDRMKALWGELAERAKGYFTDASLDADGIQASYQLNMRYPGQNFSLTFDVAQAALGDFSWLDESLGEKALELFNQRHTEEYGHIREHELPEVTGVRLASKVATPSPQVASGYTARPKEAEAASTRQVNLGSGYAETPIIDGSKLVAGNTVTGPAVIAETFTTIVVYPGWTAKIDDAGDYELVRG